MFKVTLVGERFQEASRAYNRYAETVDDDPMCMAFFNGVQWADQNPVGWQKIEGHEQEMLNSCPVALWCNGAISILEKNDGNVPNYFKYWMPLPKDAE